MGSRFGFGVAALPVLEEGGCLYASGSIFACRDSDKSVSGALELFVGL